MNTETIDTTQWLPRNTPVINPYRAAKGDIDGHVVDGKVVAASVKDITILACLITKGFLEEYHRECAMSFLELRNALFGKLQYKLNISSLQNILGAAVERAALQEAFEDVMRALTIRRARVIEYACSKAYPQTDLKKPETDMMGIAEKNAYRECFDLMSNLMDEMRETLNGKENA